MDAVTETQAALSHNVLYGADDFVANWVSRRTGEPVPKPRAGALGIIVGGKMAGGVAYTNWNGANVQVHIAIENKRALTRRVLQHLFWYPFVSLKCQAITVLVARSNITSLNLATKLGFTLEAIVRLAAANGDDVLVLKLWRSDCRWIPGDDERNA